MKGKTELLTNFKFFFIPAVEMLYCRDKKKIERNVENVAERNSKSM
jgi:hypothetical protein